MRPHLEHGDAIRMVVLRPKEYYLVICAAFQLVSNQLYQFIHYIAAFNTLPIHSRKLILLINNFANCIGEMRVIHAIKHHILSSSICAFVI